MSERLRIDCWKTLGIRNGVQRVRPRIFSQAMKEGKGVRRRSVVYSYEGQDSRIKG